MKKLFLTILCSTLLLLSYSQTTQEEYNFCIKGYKLVNESGFDMKQGYTVLDAQTFRDGERKTIFKKLVNSKTNKTAAFIMLYNKDGNAFSYYCIPTKNSSHELYSSAYNLLVNDAKASFTEKDMLRAWLWALIHLVSID